MMTMMKMDSAARAARSRAHHPPLRSNDQDTTYTSVDPQYPLYYATSKGTWRSYLAGILYILLALAALRYLQCIQYLHYCNAWVLKHYQIVQGVFPLQPMVQGKHRQGNQ
jgi:hypothetical protein